MYAMEIVNFPDPSGRQREEIIIHHFPLKQYHGRITIDLWSSKAFFCPHCCKVWATRTIMVGDKTEEFSVLSSYCPKCGPQDQSGIGGGFGLLFDWPGELDLYLERLSIPLKINEFLAMLEEYEYEEGRR